MRNLQEIVWCGRAFSILFLSFVLFFTFSRASGFAAVPNSASTPLLSKALKDLEQISKDLKNLEKNIHSHILKAEEVPQESHRFATITKKIVQGVDHYLGAGSDTLREGLLAWRDFLSLGPVFYKQSSKIRIFFFEMMNATGFAFLGLFLSKRLLFSSFQTVLQGSVSFMMKLIWFFSFCFIPILIFSSIQIAAFFMLEPKGVLRNLFVSLTEGWFVLGAVWRFTRLTQRYPIFFSENNSVGKILTNQAFFWIKWIVLSYFVGRWFAELSILLEVSEAGGRVVLGVSRLGTVISFFFLARVFRLFIMRWLYQNRLFPFLRSVAQFWPTISNVMIVGLGFFWILEDAFLETIVKPSLISASMLFILPGIYQLIRKARISYLFMMRAQKKDLFLYKILHNRHFVHNISWWVIYSLGYVVIAAAWDFDVVQFLNTVIGNKFFEMVLEVALLVLSASGLMILGDKFLKYYLTGPQDMSSSIEAVQLAGRWKTLTKVGRILLRVIIWIPTTFLILSSLHLDIVPLLTSLGFITAGLTFGAQSLVKDFVTGFFIILENSLIVGDSIDLDGKIGIVEDLSIRTLRIRMDNGTLLTVPFGSITVIGNRSRHFAFTVFNISLPYKEDPEKVQQMIEKAVHILRKNPSFSKKILGPVEIRGIADVTDYSIVFQARLKTAPGQQDIVRRGFNAVFKKLMDEAGIRVPTPSILASLKGQSSTSITNTIL